MRLFVAVDIGETLAHRAAEFSGELQRRAAAQAPAAKVTWIPADRLHLTVRFIGEVDDRRVPRVREVLEKPLAGAPFDLTLAGAGAFPKGGSPRVLWIGVTDGEQQLLAAEREISARLATLDIPPEERAYSPHLTLARVRDAAGLRSARLLDGLTGSDVGTTHIDAITLFHSTLSPQGPTYTPLLQISLGGSESGRSEDPPLH